MSENDDDVRGYAVSLQEIQLPPVLVLQENIARLKVKVAKPTATQSKTRQTGHYKSPQQDTYLSPAYSALTRKPAGCALCTRNSQATQT